MGLAAPVVENGANFSQRQLLCIARAILTRKHHRLTVLIIAHRLNTVADADMIIELSHGRVV